MWETLILTISIILQFVAVFLALRLIRITGKRSGWVLIAAAISVIAFRLLFTLFNFLSGKEAPPSLLNEWVALSTSALIAFGLAAIIPLFLSMKRSEEGLRKNEERFRSYFELGLIGMAIISPTKAILEVNDKICEILGYDRNELAKRTWAELTHPDDLAADVAQFNRVLEREIDGYSMDKRFIRKDGRVIDSTISVKCVRRPDGSVDHFVALLQDITERKRAEEALRESEERLRLALEAAQMGTFDWDIPRNRITWSRGHEKLWGLAPGEFGGTYEAFSERVHAEDLPGIEAEVSRTLAAREPWVGEFRVVWPDSSIHWMLGRGEFTFDENGKARRMRGVTMEITARRQAEEALHASRELLNNIIDSSPSYIFATDRQNRYTLINEAMTGLFGMPKKEILGKTEHGVFPKELADALQAANNRVMATGVPLQIEEVVGSKDGPPRTMITVKFPVRDAHGKIIGLGGVATDITERKRAEEALRESEQMNREQYAELHQLYQTAPVGLALVDHELRFVRINDRLAEINGRPAEQHIGRAVSEVVPQLWPSLEPIFRRVMSGEPVLDVQIHGVTPAQPGAERDWVASYYPVLGDDGFVRGASVLVQDVTESKQAEEALRKSEERFQLASRATNDAIWDWDLVTNAVRWNERFQTLFGYQPEEIESGVESWTNRIHPEDKGWVLSEVDAAIKQGHQFWSGEYRFRRGDGSYVAVFDRGYVVHDENGRPVRMIGAMLDITERKRAEEALQEAEARLRLALQAGRIGTWDWNMVNGKIVWSPSHEALWGMVPGEFKGTYAEFDARLHPEDREGLNRAVAQAISERHAYRHRFRIVWPDGSVHWIAGQGEPFFDEGGRPVRMIGVVMDITERKQAEEAVKENHERLQRALEASQTGTWRVDLRTGMDTRDASLNRMLGLPPEPSTQPVDDWFLYVHPDDFPAIRSAWEKGLVSGLYDVEHRLVRRDGRVLWVYDRGVTVRDDAGQLLYAIGAAMDITDRKRAEEEIRRLNQDLERRVVERTAQLEAVNKELESFSYSVSHDLRAPLRATVGFSRVLLNRYADRLDAQGRDFLQRIDAASLRMGELIEDLLNLSRIARREIRKEPFDLAALARSIATEIQKADPSRKVAFLIQDRLNVEGDPRLLRIALENLLGNAWKFTMKRSVATIEFGRIEREGKTIYFVRDDGAGFDMAYADKLFGPFQRLHTLSEFPGTGIGLATVQRIIHRHGGQVWAEGEVEKGATFYFTL